MQINSIRTDIGQGGSSRDQYIAEMIRDIQAGNIPAAQDALQRMHSDGRSTAPEASAAEAAPVATRNNVDFSAVINSIVKGDLEGAQEAWRRIQAQSVGQNAA